MGLRELHRRRFLGVQGGEPNPIVYNTYIGGMGTSLPTKADLATRLGISAANISQFNVVGEDIEAQIEVNYSIGDSDFASQPITSFYDFGAKLIGVGNNAFKNSLSMFFFYASGNPAMGSNVFRRDLTDKGRKMIIEIPNKTSFSTFTFYLANSERIDIRNALTLGATTGNDLMFFNIKGNPKIYAHTSLETSNSGSMEVDLVDAENYGASVVFVQNNTAPNSITNLNIGTVYATSLQLDFTPPTGNTNPIEFYECYANGIYKNTIQGSGEYIKGLNVNTSYVIEVKPVDIYNNKSTSNAVAQTTSATYVIPTANIFSSYKMEGNVLDSVGTNNGTPTAITYSAGMVGQAAMFNGTNSFIDLNSTSIVGGKEAFSLVFAFKYGGKANSVLYGSWSGSLKIIVRINSGHIQYYTHTGVQAGGSFMPFSDTTSNHVLICTYDGATMKAYLDASKSTTTYAQTGAINSGGETEKIGKERITTGDGQISELPIFNIALTDAEVSDITAKLQSGQSLI